MKISPCPNVTKIKISHQFIITQYKWKLSRNFKGLANVSKVLTLSLLKVRSKYCDMRFADLRQIDWRINLESPFLSNACLKQTTDCRRMIFRMPNNSNSWSFYDKKMINWHLEISTDGSIEFCRWKLLLNTLIRILLKTHCWFNCFKSIYISLTPKTLQSN